MARNSNSSKGRFIMTMFRFGQVLPAVMRKPFKVIYYIVVDMLLGVSLPLEAAVGPGLILRHGQGVVVSWRSTIGADCELHQHVTLGERNGGVPHLGHRVVIGANAVIVGPLNVGDDAQIGAGAVVLHDVPAGMCAVGNPARLIEPRAVRPPHSVDGVLQPVGRAGA